MFSSGHNKVLVLAPHPDDETLGCGGTLLKHKEAGDRIYWVIVTCISEKEGWDTAKVKERKGEIEEVLNFYEFEKHFSLDFPAAKLDQVPKKELTNSLGKVFDKINPDIIYVNHGGDIHSDHRSVFEAVSSATKDFRRPNIKKIVTYETISETEFQLHEGKDLNESFIPNMYVDITDFFDKKCQAFKIYDSEVMEGSLPRSLSSIEALARFRGSRISSTYAEAFRILYEKC
tara:strand:+ start:2907 stop:3599 length:693 start_codon:yes stop_codon:yes gene_type:complete